MFSFSHWLNGHESEQTLGDGKGQGSLMKMKEKREKAGLKLNIQKTKIMALVLSFHGK